MINFESFLDIFADKKFSFLYVVASKAPRFTTFLTTRTDFCSNQINCKISRVKNIYSLITLNVLFFLSLSSNLSNNRSPQILLSFSGINRDSRLRHHKNREVYRIESTKFLIVNNIFLLAFTCFYCKCAGNASAKIGKIKFL